MAVVGSVQWAGGSRLDAAALRPSGVRCAARVGVVSDFSRKYIHDMMYGVTFSSLVYEDIYIYIYMYVRVRGRFFRELGGGAGRGGGRMARGRLGGR